MNKGKFIVVEGNYNKRLNKAKKIVDSFLR